MKLALYTAAGAFMVLYAAFALFYATHARGAEPCAGITGMASYYGAESGHITANGEHFDGSSLTAASRTLPFGTRLRVTFEGRSVVVRVNDRGPYVKGRFLDLSRAAAVAIGLVHAGVGRVCAERLS